jgi:hypothetical protein
MKGHYTMGINAVKKEMNITIIGNFSNEQALQFISDYNLKVKSINAADYTLRLDCKDLNVVTPDLVDSLEACYTLYKSSNFNKVIFEISKTAIIKMQLSRIARKVGLSAEFIEA